MRCMGHEMDHNTEQTLTVIELAVRKGERVFRDFKIVVPARMGEAFYLKLHVG